MDYYLRVTVALLFFFSGQDSIPVAFGGRVTLENLSPRFKLRIDFLVNFAKPEPEGIVFLPTQG